MAGAVEVGLGDQVVLDAAQGHPLGEHVVGRRQALAVVVEADAVLGQQLAGLGVVGDQRAVRIDEVGVAGVAAGDARRSRAARRPRSRARRRPRASARAPAPRPRPSLSPRPPGGKKITRSASRGTSAKSRTIVASRRPRSAVGTAAHMPWSSWRRNSSIRRSSSSATSGSPSASRTSPCPDFIRTSFIASDYAAASPPARQRARARGRRPGPAPAPMLAQAVADRLRGDLARPARGVGELLAAGEERRQRRGVGAAGAVRGAVGIARPLDPQRCRRPSTSTSAPSSAWPPVTITASGAERRAAPRRARPRVAPSPEPGQRPRLGQVRGEHGRPRQDPLDQRRLRASGRAASRRSRRPSPGRRRPARRRPGRGPRARRRSSARRRASRP